MDITPAQLALAWILAKMIIRQPMPGTKRFNYLEENSKIVDVILSIEHITHIKSLLKNIPT